MYCFMIERLVSYTGFSKYVISKTSRVPNTLWFFKGVILRIGTTYPCVKTIKLSERKQSVPYRVKWIYYIVFPKIFVAIFYCYCFISRFFRIWLAHLLAMCVWSDQIEENISRENNNISNVTWRSATCY